jgi:hypothetical protein
MFRRTEPGPELTEPKEADVAMRRVVGVVMSLACVALLSSCSLLPGIHTSGNDDSKQQADAQMQHIADAVKHHDAAALTKLFSPRARAKASNLDSGLKYLFSIFPSGRMTWKIDPGGPGGTGFSKSSKQVLETMAYYNVKANGKTYLLFFADVTTDNFQPHNVGIYAIGVARNNSEDSAEYTASGDPTPYYDWIDTIGIDNLGDTIGDAGVYVAHK